MKTSIVLLATLSLCLTEPVRAQPTPNDPIAEHLFPPEFVLQQERPLALTIEQREFIETAIQKTQARVQAAEQHLRDETQKLTALLAKDRVDESAALAQSDRIAGADQELRRIHLRLLISIKNKLTPEQQTKLKSLTTRLQALQSKGEKIQAGFLRWQEEARDPSRLAQIMQQVEPLIRDGKFDEAEALLDRALKLLAEPKAK